MRTTISILFLAACSTGTKPTPPEFDTEVMAMLKAHTKNAEKVRRDSLPDLPQTN